MPGNKLSKKSSRKMSAKRKTNSKNQSTYIGRHIDICSYKDNVEFKETIRKFLNSNINITKKTQINPTSFQIFIGDKQSYADKDITKYLSQNTINEVSNIVKKHYAKFIIHSN